MNHARINLRQQLAKLSLPLFFDIALVMLIGAADALMLARWSDGAAGAVGMVNQLVTLVFLVYQFISMGAAILSAQYFGAGEWARRSRKIRRNFAGDSRHIFASLSTGKSSV